MISTSLASAPNSRPICARVSTTVAGSSQSLGLRRLGGSRTLLCRTRGIGEDRALFAILVFDIDLPQEHRLTDLLGALTQPDVADPPFRNAEAFGRGSGDFRQQLPIDVVDAEGRVDFEMAGNFYMSGATESLTQAAQIPVERLVLVEVRLRLRGGGVQRQIGLEDSAAGNDANFEKDPVRAESCPEVARRISGQLGLLEHVQGFCPVGAAEIPTDDRTPRVGYDLRRLAS